MIIHLITACTRPHNIPRMSASVDDARRPGVDLYWHVSPDHERQHIGGQAVKNTIIDGLADGWIVFLDDDNLLHPLLIDHLRMVVAERPDVDLIVVGQRLPGEGYRSATPGCLQVNHVDAAQLIIRRAALGDLRLPKSYAGDGLLAEMLAATLATDRIVYLNEPLCYYNRLAPAWEGA